MSIFLRTMHLYFGDRYFALKELLNQYSEKAKFNYLNETNQIGVNVWLIRVVSDGGRKQLNEILESSPLRFDCQLYEFYEQRSGKSIFMISILQQRIIETHHIYKFFETTEMI